MSRRINLSLLVFLMATLTLPALAEGPRGLPSKLRNRPTPVEEEPVAEEEASAGEEKGTRDPRDPRERVEPSSRSSSTLPGALSKIAKTGVVVLEPSWWKPERSSYSIGYEGTGTSNSALPANAIAFGSWTGDHWGYEVLAGVTHATEDATTTSTTAENTITNTKTVTTAHTGSRTPLGILLGGVIKYRLIQTSWFQFYAGFIMAASPPMAAEYTSGTRVESTPNTADPDTRTITDTNYGPVKVERSFMVLAGPKFGSEFYIKWFPNLAVGFSTGIVTAIGGATTTTSTLANRTIPVIGGVEQSPTANSPTTTQVSVSPGIRGTTFGLGGTTFSFTGVFTLRYIW